MTSMRSSKAATSTKNKLTVRHGGAEGSDGYRTNYNESESVFDHQPSSAHKEFNTLSTLKGEYGQTTIKAQGNKVTPTGSASKLK